jgi:aspartate/methionine/tyrosine aminotransferase
MLSRRSDLGREHNAFSAALDRAKHAGRKLFDLTLSNPTSAGFPYDSAAILEALADPRLLHYAPEPLGLEEAREAVAAEWRKQGHAIDARRVFLTASTSEAYSVLLKLLCDPGDEVLVPRPSYPLLEHLSHLESVRLVSYALGYDGAWHVDLESLERARSPRTRAIISVSPNNPTGSFLKRDELAALSALGLPLISDEVFAAYPLTSSTRRATSVLESSSRLTFALGGLSKTAGLPQIKLAWTTVGGPSELVDQALERLEVLLDAYLSPSTQAQLALARLLRAGETTQRAVLLRCRENLAALDRELHGSAATRLDVEGGWYAVLRLPETAPEERWVIELLERDDVVVHPGFFYDFAREPFVVLSLITPPPEFTEGVRRLAKRVAG